MLPPPQPSFINSQFGPLESVRVFPGKTFAFVNFMNAADAVQAKMALDGQNAPAVTGDRAHAPQGRVVCLWVHAAHAWLCRQHLAQGPTP